MSKQNKNRRPAHTAGDGRKHITMETPCTVSELEHLLSLVSHEGHWHDAQVSAESGKLVIGYDDDSKESRPC